MLRPLLLTLPFSRPLRPIDQSTLPDRRSRRASEMGGILHHGIVHMLLEHHDQVRTLRLLQR